MKIKLFIILFILLSISTFCSANNDEVNKYLVKYIKDDNNFGSRIYRQPNGPFVIYSFPEMAQGNYIGIIFHDIMGGPLKGKWKIANRFWQEGTWCEDVINFAWSFDGKFLFVATSSIYGDGGLYKLDLYNKSYEQLYPTKLEEAYDYMIIEIINISEKQIDFRVQKDDEEIIKTIDI